MRPEGTNKSDNPLSILAKRIDPIDQAFFTVEEEIFAKLQRLCDHFLPATNKLRNLLRMSDPREATVLLNLIPPTPITTDKWLEHFDCGETTLNDWLKNHALKYHVEGTSHSFVLYAGTEAVGYYTLSSGKISQEVAPNIIQNNLPNPLPVFILSRVAVDKRLQKRGLGRDLLYDAIIRVVNASVHVGVCALLVHTTSDQVKQFYLSLGFVESPLQAMTLVMTIETVRSILAESN